MLVKGMTGNMRQAISSLNCYYLFNLFTVRFLLLIMFIAVNNKLLNRLKLIIVFYVKVSII